MSEPILSSLPLWILLLPLLGFLVNGLAYPLAAKGLGHTHPAVAGGFATAVMVGSFVLSCLGFWQLSQHEQALLQPLYDWVALPDLTIGLALRLDRLSSIMTLIITGVGSLIHFYSIGYMSHEKGVARFFAYLNLFCFAMLLLVLSDNLLFVFFGWEGVGLCSYLLISYWYKEENNALAARKAFLVNRVGDLGFVLAMCILYLNYGTLNFAALATQMAPEVIGLLGLAAFLLFFAATGKSAQLPLYVWLPDAMAGPTPVSALIHAATMVTAGVYLFVRMHFMFDLFPVLMQLVAWTGALTALLAGTIALVQNDIKRVLAYSTVSQLGFMFLAIGVGAYHAAVFHLMTHAFFKALLFLGAGSVIHACEGEQDMRKMGGLRASLPITHATMLIGSAALMGLPLFSGFFSKDEILYETLVLARGGWLLFIVGALAALLTAIYTVRMLILTFWGSARGGIHAHESPFVMTLPLTLLAVLALVGGLFGIPHGWSHALGLENGHLLSHWLSPVVKAPVHVAGAGALSEGAVSALAVLLAFVGAALAFALFRQRSDLPALGLGRLFEAKYFVDEIYTKVFVQPLYRLGEWLARVLERGLFQSMGSWMGSGSLWSGDRMRALQNGDLQAFTLILTAGLVAIVGILLMWTRI